MSRIARLSAVATLAAVSIIGPHPPGSAGDLSIGIRIRTPSPPRPAVVVVPQPPPVVVVPQPPPVVVAPQPVLVIEPGAPVYFHAGQYFRFSGGAWFVAEGYEGPWLFVPPHRVPPRVLALPNAYNRKHPTHVEVVGPQPGHDQDHQRPGPAPLHDGR